MRLNFEIMPLTPPGFIGQVENAGRHLKQPAMTESDYQRSFRSAWAVVPYGLAPFFELVPGRLVQ